MSAILSLLLTISATFSHEVIGEGPKKLCVYESPYGLHSISIDVQHHCPQMITVELEP